MNQKKLRRLYREEKLQVRRRGGRRREPRQEQQQDRGQYNHKAHSREPTTTAVCAPTPHRSAGPSINAMRDVTPEMRSAPSRLRPYTPREAPP